MTEHKMIEFAVVVRPFYRETSPSCRTIKARNEEEAISIAFRDDYVKEVLDIKLSNQLDWNKNTIKHYWDMYR